MYTIILTLLSSLLLTANVFAFPNPLAFPQYGPASISATPIPFTISISTTPTPAPAPTPPGSPPSPSTPVPAPPPPPAPSSRPIAGVFICSDANWNGVCAHKFAPVGTDPEYCQTLDGTASSIGPDEGYTCYFYTNAVCRTIDSQGKDVLTLKHPGNANIGYTENGDFNDKLLSYQCLLTGKKCLRGIC